MSVEAPVLPQSEVGAQPATTPDYSKYDAIVQSAASPSPTPDYSRYDAIVSQAVTPPPSPIPNYSKYDAIIHPDTAESTIALGEAQSMVIPRMGTMGTPTNLLNLDASKGSEVLDNMATAAGETALDFIPKDLKGAAGYIPTPLIQTYDQGKQIYNSINDWVHGAPIDQAIEQNEPLITQLKQAETTPPLSKERFKVLFTYGSQMGMLAGGVEGIPRGKPNVADVAKTEVPPPVESTGTTTQEAPLNVTSSNPITTRGTTETAPSGVGEVPGASDGPAAENAVAQDMPAPGPAGTETPTQEGLPQGTLSVGGATPEEFMRRYALVGASELTKGNTEPHAFNQAIEKEFGSHIREHLPEIRQRAEAVVNEFQSGTGKSEMAREINRQIGITKARETPVLVRPFVAQKAALLAAEKAGAAGYKRGLREARAEGVAAAAQIKGDLLQADKFMAGDADQVRRNMIEYANAVLPVAERGRFLNAITKAMARPRLTAAPDVMYRNAFRVMKAIENRAVEVYRDEVLSDMKNTLDKSVDAPGIDVNYRRRLQGVKDVIDSISDRTIPAKTLAKLKSMKDFLARERAAGRDTDIPEAALEQLGLLDQIPLRDIPTNALEQLRDNVENLVQLGRLKAKLLERAWDAEKQRSVDELAQAPSDPIEKRPLYRAQPTERLNFRQRFANKFRQTLNARLVAEEVISPMDQLYDELDGSTGRYDGWTSRNVKGKIDLASNATLAEFVPIREASRAIIKREGLTKADLETVGIKSITEMIGRERLEAMDIRPDILDRIEQTSLTKGQQAYYDFARNTYDSLAPRIRDTAHRLYQQDMELVDNYVPLIRDWASHADREAPEPSLDVTGGEIPYNEKATMTQLGRDMNPKILSRTEQGFLKKRIEGAKTSVKLNAADLLERHVMDAMHFVHTQPTLKMLGEIVRSSDFANKYGKEGQAIVLDNLDSVATQGAVNSMQRIRWIDWIRNSTSKGAIGFRIASNFVHTSQLPIAAYHAGGPGWWRFGLQKALTEQPFVRANAAETYFRSGGEPAQADVEAMSGKVGRAGFFFARNIDKLNAQAVFMGRYAKEVAAKGVPLDQVFDVPVDPEAQALALRRMHRAVASPMAKDIPQMTSRGKGVGGNVSVARAINQFRNIFLDNWSNVRHDLIRVGANDTVKIIDSLRQGELQAGAKQVGDAASHRGAIAAAMLMSVAMETGIRMATKEGTNAAVSAVTGNNPPAGGDDFYTQLKHHMFYRIPFLGQLASAYQYGESGVPIIDAIVKPIAEAGIAAKSKHPETVAKHEFRAAQAAATVLGVPGSSQVGDIIQSAAFPGKPAKPEGETETHQIRHTRHPVKRKPMRGQ